MATLLSLLFMVLAVASYVCPSLEIGGATHMSMHGEHDSMSGCAGMDQLQPNLCQAHDQAGEQSLDKPGSPQVSPFVPAAIVLTLFFLSFLSSRGILHGYAIRLRRATAPPLSIQHCCFRI